MRTTSQNHSSMTILIILVYAFNRTKNAKLYLPSTFLFGRHFFNDNYLNCPKLRASQPKYFSSLLCGQTNLLKQKLNTTKQLLSARLLYSELHGQTNLISYSVTNSDRVGSMTEFIFAIFPQFTSFTALITINYKL